MPKYLNFNSLFNFLNFIFLKLIGSYYSFFVYSVCFLKGIKIGKNNLFIGYTTFRKGKINLIKVGKNCVFRSLSKSNLIGINHSCIISSIGTSTSKLFIGDNCGFSGTTISCFHEIKIGNFVRCGANTIITDSDWHENDPRTSGPKSIEICDNVWLGVNVTVLKGVKIGKNSIIGAGSVVTRDIPSNVIAGGNPCLVIKSIL